MSKILNGFFFAWRQKVRSKEFFCVEVKVLLKMFILLNLFLGAPNLKVETWLKLFSQLLRGRWGSQIKLTNYSPQKSYSLLLVINIQSTTAFINSTSIPKLHHQQLRVQTKLFHCNIHKIPTCMKYYLEKNSFLCQLEHKKC